MTRTLNTISGELIRVSSNKSRRTFTIRRRGSIYRTYPMSKLEFSECENMNGNDWSYFLRSNDYKIIK
jgi:hypothetical protein